MGNRQTPATPPEVGIRPDWFPRRAIVLAAGMGRRMRHLSVERPKPLTVLNGRTLLDRVLDRLADAGVEDAVVNVHYMADQVERALVGRTRPRILISDERDMLLETGGGVTRALPLLGSDAFVIHNSDCVWHDPDGDNLSALARGWNPARMDTLMLLAPLENAIGYGGAGDFHMNGLGQLHRRVGGETAAYAFAGVSIAHPRMFSHAPSGSFSLNVLWDRAIAANRAYGLQMGGVWMHVGTPEALEEAEALLRNAGGNERSLSIQG